MVANNTVLTVSYGTFSCTLEGFDDSFDTMKAIAEYFRDLAADDRYFGAEPPTPDAEMLARIAEKEIARRVEARQDQGAIVLRAADPAPTAPPTTPPVASPVTPPAAEAATAPAVTTPEAAAAPAEVAPAAKERIGAAAAAAGAAAVALSETEEDTATSDQSEAVEDAAETTETPNSAIAYTQPEAAETLPAAEPEAEPVAPTPAPRSEESVAARLQRIRAVVSQNNEVPASADYDEDEHAEDMIAALKGTAEAEFEGDVATEAEDLAALPELAEDDVETTLEADIEPVNPAEEAAAEATTENAEFEAMLAAVRRAELAEAETETEAEAEAEAEEYDAPLAEEDKDAAIEEAAETAAEPAAPVRPARPVRVVKVKRADLEAAQAAQAAQAAEAAQTPPQTPPADSSLSPEEEADLLRELAEVEAEFSQEEDLDSEDVRSIFAEEAAQAAPLPESDVSRLMEKTRSEMDDPQGAHRRNAIAHLRAAVDAKRADSAAGGALGQGGDDAGAYRNDLDTVVRPRRPVRPVRAGADEAGDTPAPALAPLRLVAEQRIDTPEATDRPDTAPVMPVRPRRIRPVKSAAEASEAAEPVAQSAEAEAAPQEATAEPTAQPAAAEGTFSSFAEYADAMGADALPDLLEAAAAYLSYVEGQKQFSRPQLMNKARQADEASFSREDGLRSFGQLLRQGKIEKLQGGRFTVSDQIGFKPDERAAG